MKTVAFAVACAVCVATNNIEAAEDAHVPSMVAATCGADSDITTKVSRYNVDETVARLEEAIKRMGLTVLTIVSHGTATAPRVVEPPHQLLVMSGTDMRTLLSGSTPLIALDLPMKLLVWQDGKRVKVSFKDVECLRKRYDVTAQVAAFFVRVGASVEEALR
ncbi:hypothetical protein GPROT1_00947 [Gammaproteobacteria bacterium]|nr:hypothetical protein GPROT1_00947 [Gammaproteobacteria bacterium]